MAQHEFNSFNLTSISKAFPNHIDVCIAEFMVICRLIRTHCRAVVSGGARGALAPPEFGSSVNPIPTRGGRLCPPDY